jgi:hypothetical protein
MKIVVMWDLYGIYGVEENVNILRRILKMPDRRQVPKPCKYCMNLLGISPDRGGWVCYDKTSNCVVDVVPDSCNRFEEESIKVDGE